MKAVIFGANGQDGFYLAELLRQHSVETIKFSRSGGASGIIGDVADWETVEDAIRFYKPDYAFHLAANSTTRHDAIFENHRAISTGTINILEAVDRHSSNTKVFLSGSAMQFENDGSPIDENTKFAATSPYAASRIASVYAARYYRLRGRQVYVGYFFNHDSPRRSEQHVNQKIARAARRGEPIEIGDVNVKKEFNYAGDAVEAVWRLVNQDVIYEAVIGSGEAHSIEEWLAICYALANRDWREYVTIKANYKPEYNVLISNPALIKSLDWHPLVDINGLAKIMMEG